MHSVLASAEFSLIRSLHQLNHRLQETKKRETEDQKQERERVKKNKIEEKQQEQQRKKQEKEEQKRKAKQEREAKIEAEKENLRTATVADAYGTRVKKTEQEKQEKEERKLRNDVLRVALSVLTRFDQEANQAADVASSSAASEFIDSSNENADNGEEVNIE